MITNHMPRQPLSLFFSFSLSLYINIKVKGQHSFIPMCIGADQAEICGEVPLLVTAAKIYLMAHDGSWWLIVMSQGQTILALLGISWNPCEASSAVGRLCRPSDQSSPELLMSLSTSHQHLGNSGESATESLQSLRNQQKPTPKQSKFQLRSHSWPKFQQGIVVTSATVEVTHRGRIRERQHGG